MKKALIILLAFVCLLSSCGVANNKTTTAKSTTSKTTAVKSTTSESKTDETDTTVQVNNEISSKNSTVNYGVTKKTYTNKDIKINYPIINGLKDAEKQNKINDLIKSYACKSLETDTNNLTLEINYKVVWYSNNLLSIQFFGYSNVSGAAYPNNELYTLNIDLNSCKEIKLTDIVNINEDFVKAFKNAEYVQYDSGLDAEKEAKENISSSYTNSQLIDYFKNDAPFYFTDNSLGISIDVIHAIGDHAEYEIKYKDISNNIKTDNEVWKDFASTIK